MKKILKNRKLVIVIIVIFLIGIYVISNKAINKYNDEIITQDELIQDNEENKEEKVSTEERAVEEEIDIVTEEIDEENLENDIEDSEEKIYVYVTGQVKIPGVVILNKGSRIIDAITAAGGITEKANTTKVNLVYVLEDGMKVNVPSNDDLKKDSNFEYITKESGEGAGDANNLNIDSNSSGTSSNTKRERTSSIVNINTATQTELETLPGIGPSTALKIINDRKENGKFSSIEDLKNVNGIGDNKFEALKKYITV